MTYIGALAMLEFVSPEIVVTEGADEDAIVCVRLVLFINDTLIGQEIVFGIYVASGPTAGKSLNKSLPCTTQLQDLFLIITVNGSDFLGPSSREALFMEGAENGTLHCFPIEIVDDDDFEDSIERFSVYITRSYITPESVLLAEPGYIYILINDTEGGK